MTKQSNLKNYLAVTVGAGCAATTADAAVTFYGVDTANDTNPDPLGIDIGFRNGYGLTTDYYDTNSLFASSDGDYTGVFTQGTDVTAVGGYITSGSYYDNGFFGGAVAGINYANISFNGDDGIYEAVGKFFFDGEGTGRLIAIATVEDVPDPENLSLVGGPALSISDGVTMIDNVPEPSALALLGLGAAGLIARRKR